MTSSSRDLLGGLGGGGIAAKKEKADANQSIATTTLNGLGAAKPVDDSLFDQSVLPKANLPQEAIEDMSMI